MSLISKPYTFSSGATIIAAEHNSNFDTIYNDYNGNITNFNVANNAAIHESKLDLSTVAQDITFTGTIDFSGATNLDITGSTADYILLDETSAPTTAANQGAIYTKEVSGNTELFFREESSGDEVQITSVGSLSIPAGTSSMEVFTSDDTWTCPTGITRVFLTMCGAGAGGGGGENSGGANNGAGGSGGGAGAWIEMFPVTVTPSSSYTLQVGVAGTGGSVGGNGTDGEDTIFDTGGSPITCDGGVKGVNTGGAATGGAGGGQGNTLDGEDAPGASSAGEGGTSIRAGGDGGDVVSGGGGGGGATPFGNGGRGGDHDVDDGTAGQGFGSGGGGGQGDFGAYTPRAGKAGAGGLIIIMY